MQKTNTVQKQDCFPNNKIKYQIIARWIYYHIRKDKIWNDCIKNIGMTPIKKKMAKNQLSKFGFV